VLCHTAGTTCHAYPGICLHFQEKYFCKPSAPFPVHHVGINRALLPIQRSTAEHCHRPGCQTCQSRFRRKARLGKLLSIFNSYQSPSRPGPRGPSEAHSGGERRRRKMGTGGEACNSQLPALCWVFVAAQL